MTTTLDVTADMAELAENAGEAANLLKMLANENRLLILCHLAVQGEVSVGELAESVGLSQSALSQHLAKLRQEGLVGARKDAQTAYYRITNDNAGRVLSLLKDIYCS